MVLKNRFLITLVLFSFCTSLTGCQPAGKTPLIVFAAGSMIQPFRDLEKAFEAANPDIDLQAEYHGSIQVIRHSTDLHQPTDVVVTADHALIPTLMYQSKNPDTGLPYASWYIRFATNSLGIAYTDQSKYSTEITHDNWSEILSRPDVKVGIADPRFDAAGYRALMVFELAGQDLFNNMFADQFRFPVEVDTGGGLAVVRVPEILESSDTAHVVIRGASVQLLALLESGDLDYAFEYDSVIRQHELRLIHLPDSLNLSNADYNPDYGKVTVLLDYQRFASVKPEFTGEQIGYGITIPSDAPHPKEAARFIRFVLGKQGQAIFAQDFQPLLNPYTADHPENMPAALKDLVP